MSPKSQPGFFEKAEAATFVLIGEKIASAKLPPARMAMVADVAISLILIAAILRGSKFEQYMSLELSNTNKEAKWTANLK